jgi:glycine cleavage system aminomethyltransferase T
VPASAAVGTALEVEIFGTWVAGQIAKDPLYDPSGEKIRI